ncbi:MAG TPA: oligoendopeptidase F [Chloroflexota bacterium]
MAEQPTRAQVPCEETWELGHIFPSARAWEDERAALEGAIDALASYAGRLGQGARTLPTFLRDRDAVLERIGKVAAYARLSASVDGISAEAQAMAARAEALEARLAAALAFVAGELCALPEGKLERRLAEEPALAPYRHQLESVLRRRGHLLAPEAERALAALGEALDVPYTIWGRVTTSDLACPPIRDEAPVTIGRWFALYALSPDRPVRRAAYESLAAGLDRHKNTLATSLATHVRRNVTMARLRGYGSAVEMILAPQRVPEPVYRNVLATVHDQIRPHVHRLIELRRRVLGLDRIYHYDLRAPLDPAYDRPTTFEEAGQLIRDGLAVLGPEYGAMVEQSIANRWVDRVDNVGKRSGAFCASVYGVHPYVFMVWGGGLRSAFTLAHELGHAGHGYLSSRSQIVSNAHNSGIGRFTGAGNSLFFVEAPSTTNELLLGRHLLDATDDPRLRRHLIEGFLGTFTHNMVTHLLEAHFEQRLYDLAEADQPITTRAVLDAQEAVFARFFGDAVAMDAGARLYWMQQPHFYVSGSLYPYTYSAGLACGVNVAEAIGREGAPAVERWLATLRLGSTLSPVELAAHAGVDMTSTEPLRRAVAFFGRLVDELERSY